MLTKASEIISKSGIQIVVWKDLHNEDIGDSFEISVPGERSVQFSGVFGGGYASLEGSNDGVNWVTLTDPQGNLISKNGSSLEAVTELTRFVRPVVTGDGSTSIDVCLLVSR